MSDAAVIAGTAPDRRLVRLIAGSSRRFGLDLAGLRVLTEAATGPFAATPLIAACAGADVRAVTRDSRYGKAAEVGANVMALARELGVEKRVTVSAGPAAAVAEGCHIVTNLGFVRPIGSAIVDRLDRNAAVALMWEPWEFRPQDVSLAALAARDIVLIGTRETHPLVGTFRHVGALTGKLLLETGIELVGSRIVVVGSDPFGQAAVDWLGEAGAEARLQRTPIGAPQPGDADIDAMVLVEHRDHAPILGARSDQWVDLLARNGAPVVRVCGAVDRALLMARGARLHPDTEVAPGFMSVTTGYLGPRPVVDLHAAGLRAAQDVVRARLRGLSSALAVEAAVSAGFALAFESGSAT